MENSIKLPPLITKRLTLRQLLESDVNQIYLLRSDKIVNKYLDRQLSNSVDDALNFIRNIQRNELLYWAVTDSDTKKLIGTICLFDISQELKKCEIGYELLTEYQGKGYMNEAIKKVIDYAVQALGITTIYAFTHKDNASSSTLLKKNNFQKTSIIDDSNPTIVVFRLTE